MKFFAFAIPAFFSLSAAASECTNNSAHIDICVEAKKIAKTLNTGTPKRLNEQIELLGAYSYDNNVQVEYSFLYSRFDAEEFLRSQNSSFKSIESEIYPSLKHNICVRNKDTSLFINLGGVVVYKIKFSGDKDFSYLSIKQCSQI